MSAHAIHLEVYKQLSLTQAIGQLRAVPVNLGQGQPKAFLLIYAEDAEIDPYVRMFFFPTSTNKLMLITQEGDVVWKRDMGPGTIPGIWFFPVFPFDMDGDGVDEIYIVNNRDPDHPLNYYEYCLERIDGQTGETRGQWQLPSQAAQDISRTFRFFIFGGFVHHTPVLVTGQGTYGPMIVQGWNPDMTVRWQSHIDGDAGTKGSHMCAVVDLANSGVDGVLWGERYIELDQGRELWCADADAYSGHSDIVQPVLDWKTGRWCIHTCRESGEAPRIVCFDQRGQRRWGDLATGHIDTGWAARLGEDGEPIVLGVRITEKQRSAAGERRTGTEEFIYQPFTGEQIDLGFSVYTTIPVDLNGDGIHELVKGYFEGDGTVLDRSGHVLGNVGGLSAMASKFIDHPGEQILSYAHDGTVRIWVDRNADDTDVAKRRYNHPFYPTNQRLTACGYNLFNLGGI
jgi:hypothetical protein